MELFQLATRIITTGEEQTAAALKRVEEVGTSAAGNITAAWSDVSFAPATESASKMADVSANLAGQIRLATSAAQQQVAQMESLGSALNKIDASQLKAVEAQMVGLQQRIAALQAMKLPEGKVSGFASVAVAELGVLQRQLDRTRQTFVSMGGVLPQVGQSTEQLTGRSEKLTRTMGGLQKAVVTAAAATVGVPGKFGAIAASLLQLSAGGAVVGAVAIGMALIGSAIQSAREKAEAESQRITQTFDTWKQRLDEMTGAARRRELEDLTKTVEDLTQALSDAEANRRITTHGEGPSSPLLAKRNEEVRLAEEELRIAQNVLDLRRATEDQTGPAAQAKQAAEERVRALEQERTAYERRLASLVRGAGIEATREESLRALQAEETRLTDQVGNGNTSLDERVRLSGLLLQVQTALGSLPQTDEQRAAALEQIRQATAGYVDVLRTAVQFESTRPQAQAEIAAAISRTTSVLRSFIGPLEERVRLEERLAELRAAQQEGKEADRTTASKRQTEATNRALAQALGGDLAGDLAIIEANSVAMITAMGPKLQAAAVDAWSGVREIFQTAPADLATDMLSALAIGIGDNNAKAEDLILESLGSIFVAMGKALIKYSAIMSKLLPILANPLNPASAVAAALAGAALVALGSAMGAAARGRSGGGGGGGGGGSNFDSYQRQEDRVVRIVVGAPAGQTAASEVTPVTPVNITVIGTADPVAQRDIATIVNAAQSRGLINK